MLQAYDKLKDLLTENHYQDALAYVQNYQVITPKDQLIKTNFYCYLTIQNHFKVNKCLTILQNCLSQQSCRGSIRALTRYHIAQIYFSSDLKTCGSECQEIISEFLGSYHMLRSHLQRTQEEEQQLYMLQYIIYYCFLLLGFVKKSEGKEEQSQNYIMASKNLLKIQNKSSECITASNFRTKSSQKKLRHKNSNQ